jgi:hypothetical protein
MEMTLHKMLQQVPNKVIKRFFNYSIRLTAMFCTVCAFAGRKVHGITPRPGKRCKMQGWIG